MINVLILLEMRVSGVWSLVVCLIPVPGDSRYYQENVNQTLSLQYMEQTEIVVHQYF
jgi:hypothetical protein